MGVWKVGRVAAVWTVVLSLAACIHAGAAAPAGTAPSAEPGAQQPRVNPDAAALANFERRVKDYMALHDRLEVTLPSLPKEATPVQIDQHQRALARLIQEARRGARPGDIFEPGSRRVVKKLMNQVFGGPDGRQLRASIMDENPGRLSIAVNGRYPDALPLSTVPPQVLAGLPELPEGLEFRFVGRRIILMDVHAHIIADYIDNALPA